MKKLLFLLIFLGGATAFAYFKAVQIIHTPIPVYENVIVQIPSGASLEKIATILDEARLIENRYYFLLYAKFNRIYPRIKAGEYLVEHDVSLTQLAELLASGKLYMRKITFPEGKTSREIGEILQNNPLLEGYFELPPEGYFLPETYTFSRGENRQKIIEQGQRAMARVLEQAWQERDAGLPLKNKEEMLILASIVEKETGVTSERPQVASVFINRLRKGMLLQTDPTVIYALTLGKKDLGRALLQRDLEIDSPYNTYKYAGLPPTPICHPGKAAIMAVAHPDKTPYLYFVASGTGGHNFARTLSEHNANVGKWRRLQK